MKPFIKDFVFQFKGKRKYLHGTDLFRYLQSFFPSNFKSIDIKFHRQINSQPKLIVLDKEKLISSSKNYLLTCNIVSKNKKNLVMIGTKKKINNSYPFDESLMYNKFKTNKDFAKCNLKTSLDDIDVVVALNKFWHNKKFNKKKGQWFFSRIKLKKKFKNKENKNIMLKKKIEFLNSTVSSIYISKVLVGEIYFIYKND